MCQLIAYQVYPFQLLRRPCYMHCAIHCSLLSKKDRSTGGTGGGTGISSRPATAETVGKPACQLACYSYQTPRRPLPYLGRRHRSQHHAMQPGLLGKYLRVGTWHRSVNISKHNRQNPADEPLPFNLHSTTVMALLSELIGHILIGASIYAILQFLLKKSPIKRDGIPLR